MIALAVLSVACAKNEEDKPNGNDVPQEEQTGKPGADGKIVFTAMAPTKTAIDSNDEVVTWVAGDEVKFVWAGGSTTATASASGSSTTFSVEVGDGVTELYAVYPASAGGSYESGNVNIHFNGSLSDGSFAANDICVAKAVKTGDTWSTTLAFKNAACLLKVGVTSSSITQLQVLAVNGEEITGYLPISIDGGGNVSYGAIASGGSDHVTMSVSGPGSYYIPVLPGVTLATGFEVKLFEGSTLLTPFYYYGSFTTERGKVIKLNDIESHAGQFYVTPSGAGTKSGQSWNNAMDAAGFKALVENQDNHFILKGSTFHFSAEEFSFGDDYVKPAYPDHANVAFTIEGTVTATDTTTFLGRTATSGTTAGVLWPQQNSYITIKNVKFTGTNGASNASAIRLNNSAKELTLDHCYFRNNQTSGNGGAISLFNSATVNIKDCSFSNNTGAGGIIHVNNASAKVNIQDSEAKGITKNAIYGQSFDTFTCTRVTFKDNDDAGEYGAAAYLTGAGTITFDDCEFIRNHSSVQGGAICINGTSVTSTFTDCEFIDNSCAQRGGAVMIESGNANTTFTGGKFQGNHADGGSDNSKSAGGAIFAMGDGVVFACTDVLFKSNYSNVGTLEKCGGIIRVENATGKATFDGCVFDGNYCYRSSSVNPACAAIVNNRSVDGSSYYFNACEFKNNASGTYAGTGAKYGMVFAAYNETTLAFNNCSIHDNYGGRNTDPLDWIYIDNVDVKLIFSNSSVIGDPSRKTSATGSASQKNGYGVFYLSKDANYYFVNNILCSPNGGRSLNCGTSVTIENSYYNKTSPVNGTCDWGTDTGSGHDYTADSSCFGSWSAPYTWNGTMSTGTNSSMKAATADVNTEIQNADADFYAWLNCIGALGKDINGNSRGDTSWPGCYQN